MSFTDSNGLTHYPGCADICGNHPHDPLDYPCVCAAPLPGRGRRRAGAQYPTCTACQALIVPENVQLARRVRTLAGSS